MTIHTFTATLWLPRPINEVFDFFASAENLQAITPDWLHFRILTAKPISLRAGSLIDYRLRIHGLPVRWQTEITAWEPPHRFVDEQRRGPYRQWIHEHRFAERAGGTDCDDLVRYAVPGGAFINWLLVRRDVARIFSFRRERLQQLIGGTPSASAA